MNKDILKRFNEYAEELEKKSNFLKQITSLSKVIISGNKDGIVHCERFGSDEQSIRAFILTFRIFIQDSEETSIHNLSEIYNKDKQMVDIEKRILFNKERNKLNSFLESPSMFIFNDVRFSNRKFMNTLIYGYFAHKNPDKRARAKKIMNDAILTPLSINYFEYILHRVFVSICYFYKLNQSILKF